ncbi:putative oxygenase MesX [Plantibacter sp. ME-Dv--P-095]|uniref:putative oxygenase MesX n=1 Tax=Plantibacter sp. ME-Dv--P-095 TaxID=3040299 RepID=UPI00254EADE1|nr:putative oxygenase MesX [Plantibacter sp. ME-Dv--P-095]
MTNEFTFSTTITSFDEDYSPAESSRITTNFANLARGARRKENLRTALAMIDDRFNDLVPGDDPSRGRYTVGLDIVSVGLRLSADGEDREFPLLEVLRTRIIDRRTGRCQPGTLGNNFSSYLRDHDFSVRLPAVNASQTEFTVPDDFGVLHGALFKHFLTSAQYAELAPTPPVICISVSTSRTYRRTGSSHPILGVEYRQDELSLTDRYFAQMGLRARFFMPPGSAAPLAFYSGGELLEDYSDLQLVATISTMETFQKIYRPEIYGARSVAADVYRPNLEEQDYARPAVAYDREERGRLAIEQGQFAEEHLMKPHGERLRHWAAGQTEAVR